MKVGVIGTGWGLRLIESLGKLGIEPVLVYGHKNRDKLQHLNFAEDVNEIFSICDTVIAAVPPEVNSSLVLTAVETNTNLFVEKPMAVSIEDAEYIKQEVDKSNITFMVGHCFCYANHIDEIRFILLTHAVGSIKRQPSTKKINPYWHLAVHHIALFTLLEIETYFIQIILDKSFVIGGHNYMEFWDSGGDQIAFRITGDYITNELKHFLDCCESGVTPLTDAEHGLSVIKQLTERYGNIDQCLGG